VILKTGAIHHWKKLQYFTSYYFIVFLLYTAFVSIRYFFQKHLKKNLTDHKLLLCIFREKKHITLNIYKGKLRIQSNLTFHHSNLQFHRQGLS